MFREAIPEEIGRTAMDSASNFFYLNPQEAQQRQDEASREIEDYLIKEYVISNQTLKEEDLKPFSLSDVLPELKNGVNAIVRDSFTDCFRPKPPDAWNWNFLLFLVWVLGTVVRYGILLPIRFVFLLVGNLVFFVCLAILMLLPRNKLWETSVRKLLRYYAGIWLLSIAAIIKFHGVPPVRRKNQIYVSNHTSLIDFIILTEHCGFATVGQKHPGTVGFLQDKVISPLKNIWFERFEEKDRKLVAKRISDHINNLNNPPLMIFPEGVCVNNEYVVLFKKGVFELEDVEICPIAIKYNKLFSDPYWSSKDESFMGHITRLMKSWCLVCDVYFLEPEVLKKGEDPIQFAARVQKTIADRIGLKNLHWDGYLKYFSASQRLIDEQQKLIANRLKRKLKLVEQLSKTSSVTTPRSGGNSPTRSPRLQAETENGVPSIQVDSFSLNGETKKDR